MICSKGKEKKAEGGISYLYICFKDFLPGYRKIRRERKITHFIFFSFLNSGTQCWGIETSNYKWKLTHNYLWIEFNNHTFTDPLDQKLYTKRRNLHDAQSSNSFIMINTNINKIKNIIWNAHWCFQIWSIINCYTQHIALLTRCWQL